MTPRSLLAQIAEVERELKMRRSVYPRMIAKHSMKQGEAAELILIMENVLETLMALERAERGLDD